MPQVQHYGASIVNVMTFFITLLCASQVYASCTYSADSTDCTSGTFPTSIIIGVVIAGVLLAIMGIIVRIRRRKSQRRVTRATFVYRTPSNSYGRRQSNVYQSYPTQSRRPPDLQSSRPVPGQMNSLNRQGMTLAPLFPQPSHPSPTTHSTRTRSPTMPSPTHQNQVSPSSPNSTRLPPLPPPSTYSRVSADPSTIQTPSISVTPAAYTPHASPVGRPSLPENMEMGPLTMNTEVVNDEPPPAYTPNQ